MSVNTPQGRCSSTTRKRSSMPDRLLGCGIHQAQWYAVLARQPCAILVFGRGAQPLVPPSLFFDPHHAPRRMHAAKLALACPPFDHLAAHAEARGFTKDRA